jgi:hypothetical protein
MAQDAPAQDRFFIRGALYFPAMNTTLRIDPNIGTGNGSDVSLERDLNFTRRPVVASGEAGWRFSSNWRLTFEYLGLKRSETATIDRDLVIGDTTYPISASLTGSFKSNIYKVQLGYSVIRDEKAELGFSLGAHLTDFATTLEGATAGGTTIRTETRSILAPLPNIGAFGHVRLFGPVNLTGRVNWLQLKIDNYSGGLTDADVGLAWRVADHFSATASWRIINYRLDVERANFEGSIRYRFSGPTIGMVATF